jgi:hypothetical protein
MPSPQIAEISIIALNTQFSDKGRQRCSNTLSVNRGNPYKYGRPCDTQPLLPSPALPLISAKCNLEKEEKTLSDIKKQLNIQTKIVWEAEEKFREEDKDNKAFPSYCPTPPPTFPKHLLYLWPDVFEDSMPMMMAMMMHKQRQDMKHKLKCGW